MKFVTCSYGLCAFLLALSGCGVMTAFPDSAGTRTSTPSTGGTGNAVDSGTFGNSTGGSTSNDASTVQRTPVEIHGQLSVHGTLLIDQQGSPVQLKGPSSMMLNWESAPYAENKQGVQWMRDNWNARIIRAAMAITPNNAYLNDPTTATNQVKTIVQNAIDLGLYVIIDWHDFNAEAHQDQAVAFFSEMAQTYGSYPNVLYEPYNEPQKVDWSTVVKPYHEAVIKAIRAVDPDNVILLGTPFWSQYVDQAATDPIQGDNLMYVLHFYSCSHQQSLRDRGNYALDRGLAIFVTEWGATNADGGTTGTLCLDEAQLWHDWMNQNGISWTAWKFDSCTDLSCYFKVGTPITGGWTDDQLNGHGPFVRDKMREITDLAPDAL